MLTRQEESQRIHGIRTVMGSILISHLPFADGSYLFFKLNGDLCKRIKATMEDFANLSGLKISKDKSELLVCPFCKKQKHRWYREILGVKLVNNPSKYLEVELRLLNARKKLFKLIIEKIQNKIKGWKCKLLSRGGKLTLINSALARTPNYLLSCFKAPNNVYEEIYRCTKNFWCGHENNETKLHMASWDRLCKPKWQGGPRGLFRKTNLANYLGNQTYWLQQLLS